MHLLLHVLNLVLKSGANEILIQADGEDIPPPKADFSAPPPYEVATKLPSYEEVQLEKSLQGELHMVS